MIKKLIVLDTETTGLEVEQGHRIVEVGAVALADRKRTDLHFHSYLNPQRAIDEEAEKVHGLSLERLTNEPEFAEIAESFLEFVEGSILVIHNAPFDLGFLNAELKRVSSTYPTLEEICDVEDTLQMARNKFPGQRNSLDALANRFEISGYDRSFHGALLDANILADVYMHLTGGQSKFEFMTSNINSSSESELSDCSVDLKKFPIPKIMVSKEDMLANDQRIEAINSKRDSS
ncbi:MAG: DNA polymerase III subunit epsilon [Gammaproteobacteria bacterium]|jgi:DNA polymerase-3 subunit epsilon|nr:DNA polymerase III subunit epsilon [Gammaproteobacteria bacterium]RPG40280.1 MAG: DNA polymerase III subunit epsilon [Gammaproteobacteria bacterium TMED236]|tara:strand:+ start:1995 stop:2693 length:699 start_codon:yes stop_codon:yes gene_type:complete